MLFFFLPLLSHAWISNMQISDIVCGCNECLINPITFGTPLPTNDSWLGAYRDFYPHGTLSVSGPCTSVYALLLNDTFLDMYLPLLPIQNECVASLPGGSGDITLVVGARNTTQITIEQKFGSEPNARIVSWNEGTLVLDLVAINCVLPPSFAYCGVNVTLTACNTYKGPPCVSQSDPPAGCNGQLLFAPQPFPGPFIFSIQGIMTLLISMLVGGMFACLTTSDIPPQPLPPIKEPIFGVPIRKRMERRRY